MYFSSFWSLSVSFGSCPQREENLISLKEILSPWRKIQKIPFSKGKIYTRMYQVLDSRRGNLRPLKTGLGPLRKSQTPPLGGPGLCSPEEEGGVVL